jgi:hypothetical protein
MQHAAPCLPEVPTKILEKITKPERDASRTYKV